MKALAQTSATDSPTERHSEPSSHRWKCILLSLPGSKELGGAPKRSWRPGCSERNSHKVFDLTKRKVMFWRVSASRDCHTTVRDRQKHVTNSH